MCVELFRNTDSGMKKSPLIWELKTFLKHVTFNPLNISGGRPWEQSGGHRPGTDRAPDEEPEDQRSALRGAQEAPVGQHLVGPETIDASLLRARLDWRVFISSSRCCKIKPAHHVLPTEWENAGLAHGKDPTNVCPHDDQGCRHHGSCNSCPVQLTQGQTGGTAGPVSKTSCRRNHSPLLLPPLIPKAAFRSHFSQQSQYTLLLRDQHQALYFSSSRWAEVHDQVSECLCEVRDPAFLVPRTPLVPGNSSYTYKTLSKFLLTISKNNKIPDFFFY